MVIEYRSDLARARRYSSLLFPVNQKDTEAQICHFISLINLHIEIETFVALCQRLTRLAVQSRHKVLIFGDHCCRALISYKGV